MFTRPFSFQGRIRRKEFGLSYLIFFVVFLGISLLSELLFKTNGDAIYLKLLFILPLYYFMIAQSVKRSHDLGNSGWYILIPFYGFWLLFADSKYGYNEYGPNPKGFGERSEFDDIARELLEEREEQS